MTGYIDDKENDLEKLTNERRKEKIMKSKKEQEQKHKPINKFILIGTLFFLLLPFWLLGVFLLKLKSLDCIDTTNKMYMILGVTFIYAYVTKYYFNFVWRK